MKRKFSLVLAAACLFSSLSFGGIVKAASTSFSDVTSSTQYSSAIITLSKLGIINGYDDGNGTFSFKPEGEITRAEFTKIITVALGIADSAAADTSSFTDVNEHWAKKNIILASGRGIVNGFEDSTFRPDEQVTYEQAVKMIVCAAGYEPAATALGGWPNGYIAEANTLGITKGAVNANQSGAASRGIVAQLIYNVLEVDVPVYNATTGRLESNLETFMETYMGIVKEKATIVGIEDKVTADFADTLLNDEMAVRLKGNEIVKMDYTTYTEDKSVIENLLGQQAVVFYKEGKGGDVNTLVELDLETVKNTITTINSEDIDSFNGSNIRYYTEDGKSKSISFKPEEISVYYNGKAVTDFESRLDDWLSPASTGFIYGELRLTDSGSDNSIDIIEITDYEFMVATKTPSTVDYTITNKVKFKNGNPDGYLPSVVLDPDDVKYTFTITNASGASISTTSIKANDVVLVAASLDGDMYTVKVNSTPVTGKITAYSSDENKVTINSKDYKISDFAQQYFDENGIKIESSTQGTFYVDNYNTIVYGTLSTTEVTYPYAYIVKAVLSDDQDSATVTAYVPSAGGVKTYSIPEKVKLNGESMSVEGAVEILKDVDTMTLPDATRFSSVSTTGANVSKIARISVNGTEIDEIITVDETKEGTKTEDSSAMILYDSCIGSDGKLAYTTYKGSNNFDGKFIVNSSTTFIYVPSDRSKTSSYSKRTMSSFTSDSRYLVQPYNVNNSKIANLVLLFGSESSSSKPVNSSNLWLMSENIYPTMKNDEEVYAVNFFNSAATAVNRTAEAENINLDDEDVNYNLVDVADLGIGDLFRAGSDSSQGLMNAEIAISYNDVKEVLAGDEYDFTDSKFEWYSSYKKDGSVLTPYETSSYGYAYAANVVEVLEDGGKYSLRLTRDGFVNGKLPEDINESIVSIEDSTIIYRFNDAGNKVTPYLEGSTTERVTADGLNGAVFYDTKCSKVAVYMYGTKGTDRKCKMILIYE
ncbi:MAG: S-layer homology domain-containing protein [Clostridia bacterium]|nr:S-layer homology domain-containing protein [Clostridia bacterium]